MPAAGSGRRFGAQTPKQYMPLAGRTVVEHALAPFLADARCRQIVVALDPADVHFQTLPPARDTRVSVVDGGAQRADSVRAALQACTGDDHDWVLVHDAARPCVTRADIDTLLAALASDAVGGLLAVPLSDTLKRGDDRQRVLETPTREALWRALTPQMFRLGVLRAAMLAARQAGRAPTDEAQAIEWYGRQARLVAGSAGNIKVTTPADLHLAAAWLASGSVAT